MALVPWLITPGRVQPDTKVDLTISPWSYLARSVDAWNGHAGLGELQNQAYGYLFPMGPVFGIAHSAGVPPWAAQRIWWTILVVVAFCGAVQLMQVLRVGGPGVILIAGAAYALSPRILTLLAENSSEAWPMAVAPWLVVVAHRLLQPDLQRRELLRTLALSGLLTAALGGVNAAASGLMLVLPGLYLVTHRLGRRRLGPWLLAVLLGASWWLLPLLILGGYAYPFLDFIETASMTTAVTSVPNVLRGDSDWIAYILDSAGHPVWQSGWTSAQSTISILATTAVAGLGLVGLSRIRGHLRRFALASVLVGVLFMTIGHRGIVGSPIAAEVRALLDGPLAPLRNVHKADALIRLPVVLGLAVLLEGLRRSVAVRNRLLGMSVALLVVAAMTPLWQGRVGDSGSYRAVPASWPAMAHRLDRAAATAGGSTLLWPDARTATYDWGTTGDDPMSALTRSPVVFRAAAPLGDPSATRMLDTADQLAASGQVQPGLAPGLARMGIARIVVRHSIAAAVQAQPWRAVERTLSSSPGFSYVGSTGSGSNLLTLWSVKGSATAAAYARDAAVTVAGGPESVFDLATVGALGPHDWMQVVPGGGLPGDPPPRIITDSLRWRTLNSGVPTTDGYSPTLPAADNAPDRVGGKDLPPAGGVATQPVRSLIGMTSWSASSSGGDPFARVYAGPGAGIAAAFDGDPATAWRTGDGQPHAELSFTPNPATAIREVDVILAAGAGLDRVGKLRLSVGGVTGPSVQVAFGQQRVRLTLPRAAIGPVRIDLDVAGTPTGPVMGITDVRIAGHRLGSVISLPGIIDPSATSVLVRRDPREHSSDPTQGEDPSTLTRRLRFARNGQVVPIVWLRTSSAGAVNSAGAAGTADGRCGAAGTLHIGSESIPLRFAATAVTTEPAASRAQTTIGALRKAEACTGRVPVQAGRQEVSVAATKSLRAELVYLHSWPVPGNGASHGAVIVVQRPDAAQIPARTFGDVRGGGGELRIGAGPARVAALTQGFNKGWHGTVGGRDVAAVRVDGWRQGFLVPAGPAAVVRVQFGPTWWQRAGLLTGAGAVLLLALLFLSCSRIRTARDAGDGAPAAALMQSMQVQSRRAPTVGATAVRATTLTWILPLVVGTAVSGVSGFVVGALMMLLPQRLIGWGIGVSMVLSGVFLAGFGVVDELSVGAVLGQAAGTITVCLLARRLGSTDAPGSEPDAPAASLIPGPPSPR